MSGARRLMHRILDHPALANGLLIGVYLAAAATGIFGVWWPHALAAGAVYGLPAVGGSWLAILGGVAGAVSVPDGVWWLERGAVVLLAGAISARIYCGAASTIRGSVLCEVWARRSG